MHFLFLQGKLHSIVLVTDQPEFSSNIARNIMEKLLFDSLYIEFNV